MKYNRRLTDSSVEGSTIIIAACIPVLQPLADRVFGSRVFSSRNYKNYGTGKSGPHSDMELSYHARRRTVKDPNGLTFLDHAGSEENILPDKNGVKQSITATSGSESQGISPGDRGIVRTDVITVSHESGSQLSLGRDRHYQQGF